MGLEPPVPEFDDEGDFLFFIFSTCYNRNSCSQYMKLMSSKWKILINCIHANSLTDLTTALAASLFFHENDWL